MHRRPLRKIHGSGIRVSTQGSLITDLRGLNVLNTVIAALAQYRKDVRRCVLRYWNARNAIKRHNAITGEPSVSLIDPSTGRESTSVRPPPERPHDYYGVGAWRKDVNVC